MFKLTVPLESQQKSQTCWHASALMIWRYSQTQTGKSGPMDSLNKKWANNSGINPAEFILLAQKAGLISVQNIVFHTEQSLETLLKQFGPLWCAGYWYGGLPHVVVLTGVDANNVYINDPDRGKAKTGTITWFNSKLASSYIGCLKAKNPKSY